MKTSVVLTTINEREKTCIPILEDLCRDQDWDLIVVGDKKTPHMELEHGVFLSADDQEKLPYKLCKQLPWNCYERKNIGYLYAYHNGADYIVNTDDDNYPIDGWENMLSFFNVKFGPKVLGKDKFCNPLKYFNNTPHKIWPRGLPLHAQSYSSVIDSFRYDDIGVVAGLWDGCPDFDALGHVYYDHIDWEFAKDKYIVKHRDFLSPYNTQNTVIRRDLIPFQMLAVGINRADDIWAGYVSQYMMKHLDLELMYISPTVYQKRNQHDPVQDFHDEKKVFLDTEDLIEALDDVSSHNKSPFDYYMDLCYSINYLVPGGFIRNVEAWLQDVQG